MSSGQRFLTTAFSQQFKESNEYTVVTEAGNIEDSIEHTQRNNPTDIPISQMSKCTGVVKNTNSHYPVK